MPRRVWIGLTLLGACSFNADGAGSGAPPQVADTGSETGLPSTSSATTTLDTTTGGADTTVLDSSSGNSGDSNDSTDSNDSNDSSDSSGEPSCETQWWDLDWTRRRRLTIDASSVADEQTSVPIRVRLDATRIDYGQVQEGGLDLRFVAEDLSELDYEVEYWDESGDSEVWLGIPTVPAASQPSVWMYYGNATAPAGDNPTEVWDSDFVSVHHLDDLSDATAQGHDGYGPNLPGDAEGMIGRGRLFDGMTHQFEIPQESDFDFTTELTVEVWARIPRFTINHQALITKGDTAWRLHRMGMNSVVAFGSNDSGGSNNVGGMTPVDDNLWHHLAIVYSAQTKYVYVDGQLDGSLAYPGPINENGSTVMFGNNSVHPSRFFNGTMDEARISSIARSADWIGFQARVMEDDGIVSIGPEQACP